MNSKQIYLAAVKATANPTIWVSPDNIIKLESVSKGNYVGVTTPVYFKMLKEVGTNYEKYWVTKGKELTGTTDIKKFIKFMNNIEKEK